jgi:hypothetical protein
MKPNLNQAKVEGFVVCGGTHRNLYQCVLLLHLWNIRESGGGLEGVRRPPPQDDSNH